MVLTVILLVNLLIALMSKTFDIVYENKAVNYNYLFSRLVISYGQQPLLPPPLNVLHFAGKLFYGVSLGIMRVCRLGDSENNDAAQETLYGPLLSVCLAKAKLSHKVPADVAVE